MDYDDYGSNAVELAIDLANADRTDSWVPEFLTAHDEWFTDGTALELTARQARAVVARLHREGLNGREIAYCLGVTPQRVSQLLGGVGRQKAAKPF